MLRSHYSLNNTSSHAQVWFLFICLLNSSQLFPSLISPAIKFWIPLKQVTASLKRSSTYGPYIKDEISLSGSRLFMFYWFVSLICLFICFKFTHLDSFPSYVRSWISQSKWPPVWRGLLHHHALLPSGCILYVCLLICFSICLFILNLRTLICFLHPSGPGYHQSRWLPFWRGLLRMAPVKDALWPSGSCCSLGWEDLGLFHSRSPCRRLPHCTWQLLVCCWLCQIILDIAENGRQTRKRKIIKIYRHMIFNWYCWYIPQKETPVQPIRFL